MTNTTTNTKPVTMKPKSNGTNPEETSEQSATPTNPTPSPTPAATEKKPVTVMIPESLHKRAKITAELSGMSLSDLVESQLKILVKEKLPALLAGLDAEG